MAYTKYKDPWLATDLLSGKAFNHLETQWDEIKADADVHNHDTRYYTRTLGDTVFFSKTFFTGFDADKVDGLHYADVVSAALPIGSVMIWSGAANAIPTHWALCDGGTYGGKVSPNLKDRFVIGAGSTYAVNATGGPAAYNTVITPTATVTVGDHILTTAELPAHTHPYTESKPLYNVHYASSAYTNRCRPYSVNTNINNQAVGDGAHGHTGSTMTFDTIDSRPPYHALCYIIKYE